MIQSVQMMREIRIISAQWVNVENCLKAQKIIIPLIQKPEHISVWRNLWDIQTGCRTVTADFSTISFFQPENDFLSTLSIDFSVPIFRSNDRPDSDNYIRKQESVKQFILDHIELSPETPIDIKNISLYEKKIVFWVLLNPETEYTIRFDTNLKTSIGDKTEWKFLTPLNKTLLLRSVDRVTLYNTQHPPVMELLGYNVEKKTRTLTVCPIEMENYGKIEIFLKNNDIARAPSLEESKEVASMALTPQEEFFYSGIDALLDKKWCASLDASFWDDVQWALMKREIPLAETLKKLWEVGLFAIFFENKEDRYFNGRMQAPLLLGSINSHITMKVGQNGETFFFVNDFAWNPVGDMQITAVLNDYESHSTVYNEQGRKMSLNSPLDNKVFSGEVTLGKTDKNGILKTELKWKISEFFSRTFENSYEFDENGKYPSFFVTGQKNGYKSYVSSMWNSGIAPWNFGYQVNSWYDNSGLNTDNLSLSQWIWDMWNYNAHLFTDRVLYLPGELVSIKAIVRNSANLSIPHGKKFILTINNSEWTEVKRTQLIANDFGSILDTYLLPRDTALGSYSIGLLDEDEKEFMRTGFTVEVFKNPKFRTEIQLQTQWLSGEEVVITEKGRKQEYSYYNTVYSGKFTITANLIGRYYSGWMLSKIPFDYKVYRQEFFDMSYWAECYYGCFWEPQKEFYTEGVGTFDANGGAQVTIPVDFASSYSDYRYIVEVTPKDAAGDILSSTNSIIARLPEEFKLWNPNSSITLSTEKRFYPTGSTVKISGKLNYWEWSDNQDDKYLLIVKKKEFETKTVADVRGYARPVTTSREKLVEIIPISKKRFTVEKDGTVSLDYTLQDTAEYIFQFGKINSETLTASNIKIGELVELFRENNGEPIEKKTSVTIDATTDLWSLSARCIGGEAICSNEAILHGVWCDVMSNEACLGKWHTLSINQKFTTDDLITGKLFISLLTYSDTEAKNPIVSDNKVQILSEKVSYKIGEKARILVRLPFTGWKILWTVEKKGVEQSEIIDVVGNIFFREITVDESFAPNAYIGVVAIDTNTQKIPAYKVGYTEIVVDKTDKKSAVKITTDKATYSPRDVVTIDVEINNGKIQKKSEVAIMVIDDSLISLMGNIDMNTLEKIWIKLPFQIQTNITNIAMLKNFYFARPWIVGWSGDWNNKGGDSSESTRNIFKNTAYYNGRVITDERGRARVTLTLPDNLTQFRIMAIANGVDNTFGAGEKTFEVKKNVIIEDKTPLILRDGDTLKIGGNVFNLTGEDMEFSVSLNSENITSTLSTKKIFIKNGQNTFVSFDGAIKPGAKVLRYTMRALGNSAKNTDSVENTIQRAESPTFIQRVARDDVLWKESKTYTVTIPDNTLVDKSTYSISISSNPLHQLESIIGSLLIYPYGCIEQTVSSTVPNMLALELSKYFSETKIDKTIAQKSLSDGLVRIQKMQTESGWFGYWEGDLTPNPHITPYVVRSLLMIQKSGYEVDQTMISRGLDYISTSLRNSTDITQSIESLYTLALSGNGEEVYKNYIEKNSQDLNRHDRIMVTHALVVINKEKYNKEIENNIRILKGSVNTEETNSWYWDRHSDKALFATLLIAYDYDRIYITELIKELAENDFEGYFMSTQSKNLAFIAFIEFMKKYNNDIKAKTAITINGKTMNIDLKATTMYRETYPLKNIEKENQVSVALNNKTETPVFVSIRLNSYPAVIEKIKPASTGIQISRTLYEVLDSWKLSECSTNWYGDKKDCDKIFKEVNPEVLKKWKTYKVKLTATFPKNTHKNLILEDYLPATFRVLRSNFRTDSIATNQATTGWDFNHIEVQPGLVMAHSEYLWGDEATYEYFVVPEFEGTFMYPPATAYLMYKPDTHAYGMFSRITVTQ